MYMYRYMCTTILSSHIISSSTGVLQKAKQYRGKISISFSVLFHGHFSLAIFLAERQRRREKFAWGKYFKKENKWLRMKEEGGKF